MGIMGALLGGAPEIRRIDLSAPHPRHGPARRVFGAYSPWSGKVVAMSRRASVWLVLVVLAFIPTRLLAQCDVAITKAGPCDSSGQLVNPPQVGAPYHLTVVAKVTGTPARPFRIKWTVGNQTVYTEDVSVSAGVGYTWVARFSMALDCELPWSVTLDPDNVSGDADTTNNTLTGSFTPRAPLTTVAYWGSTRVRGTISSTVAFLDGSGTIGNLWVLFGVPTMHAGQSIVAAPGPAGSQKVTTAPYSTPIFEVNRSQVAAGAFTDTHSFTAGLQNAMVNPTKLRDITWFDLEELEAPWPLWVAADPTCEAADAAISAFVAASLPANYRHNTTPYDAARLLHLAVVKALAFTATPLHADAVQVLRDGQADSGGFAALMVACLRNVGIPARRVGGMMIGDSAWYYRVEWCLNGADWMHADPTASRAADPTGTYPYYFGYMPDADRFLAMDACDLHHRDYAGFALLQQAAWWCSGGATFDTATFTAHLEEVTTNTKPTAEVTIDKATVPDGTEYIISANYADADGDPASTLQATVYTSYGVPYLWYDLAPDPTAARDYRAGVRYTATIPPHAGLYTGVNTVRVAVSDGLSDAFLVTKSPAGDTLQITIGYASRGLACVDSKGYAGQWTSFGAVFTHPDTGAVMEGKRLTFKLAGASVGSDVTGANGVGRCGYDVPVGAAGGPYPIQVDFAGDADCRALTATGTLTVYVGASVWLDSVAASLGETVRLQGTLKRSDTGAVLAGETVRFTAAGQEIGSAVTGADGVAGVTYTLPTAVHGDTIPVTAQMVARGYYVSGANTMYIDVTKKPSAVTAGSASAVVGDTVTLVATLTSGGTPLEGRHLSFSVGGYAAVSAPTDVNGRAALAYTILEGMAAGSYAVKVDFSGDSRHAASSATGSLTVSLRPTGVAVPDLSGYGGDTVTLSATLTRTDTAVPIGSRGLMFRVDGAWAGSAATLSSTGTATLNYAIPAAAAAGAHTISVEYAGEIGYAACTGTGTLTVMRRDPPTVTGITPNSGLNIGSVNITSLDGTGFRSGAKVKLTATGLADIAATNVTVVSATQITCTLNLSGKAAGSYAVVVTNADTQSGAKAGAFTVVKPPAPTVTAIAPSTALNIGSVDVTNLTGTGFLTGAAVKLTATGKSDIVATNVTVVSPTKITCTLPLTGAAAGVYAVVVTNVDSQSGSKSGAFTVTAPPAPKVTAIVPTKGLNNASLSVTNLAGTGFLSGAAVKLTATGKATITATDVVVVSATKITCTLPLSGAAVGVYTVVVTNVDAQSGSKASAFTVTAPPAPKVSAITPNKGINNASLRVTNLAGTGFVSGAAVKLTATGKPTITATDVAVVSSTRITCTLPLSGAAAGTYTVVVTNPDSQSGSKSGAFTVTAPPAPKVSAITPTKGINNASLSVTNLAGTGFVSGAAVKLTATGKATITATGVTVVSATKITCTLPLTGAAVGVYAVVVTNPDAQSGSKAGAFTVTAPPAPKVTAITPSKGANTGWLSVTNLAGTGFVSGAAVKLTATGKPTITATDVSVVSATKITCTLPLTGAAVGVYAVVVTNPDAQSGSKASAFTVKK